MTIRFLIPGILCLAIGTAQAATPADTVIYKPSETWVAAEPAVDAAAGPTSPAVLFRYLDNQIKLEADGTQSVYTAYQIKILKPEALSAGNLTVAWQPDGGPITVHHVRLIRDGKTIDILASTRFTVLQREQQLEQSMLTGQRTATLQVPGLQVGDELAFAFTIKSRWPVFAGKVAGLMQMPALGMSGTFRFRVVWPEGRKLRIGASRDFTLPQTTTVGGQNILDVTLHDPKGAIPTEGAPARYNIRRLVEYSDFGSWNEISRELAPLFDRAAALSPTSPVKAEIAAIAARTNDPVERAQAALQLVEDRIRYVYVGLNGGNYVPADIDETWKRRFGDCKAKTVLLVSILRELGIQAVPALVNSQGGDGLEQRLPNPQLFDHVIVRAVIDGKAVWLDGARRGDAYLDNLPAPFRWALPLTTAGSTLEAIPPRDVKFPLFVGIVEIDATAGVDQDAKVSVKNILRGDEAIALREQLAGLSAEDADRAIKAYWRQQVEWVIPDKASWSFDTRRAALSLDLIGRGNPGWEGSDDDGHSFSIPGAGFYKPDAMRRPADQDQTASWAVPFPRFRCWATTIRLPKPGKGFAWSLYAEPENQRLGGIAYWRAAGFENNVVRTVMSSHSYEAEVSPEEAETLNREAPKFNNNMSNIAEKSPRDVIKASKAMPFDDATDWVNAPTPCDAN